MNMTKENIILFENLNAKMFRVGEVSDRFMYDVIHEMREFNYHFDELSPLELVTRFDTLLFSSKDPYYLLDSLDRLISLTTDEAVKRVLENEEEINYYYNQLEEYIK